MKACKNAKMVSTEQSHSLYVVHMTITKGLSSYFFLFQFNHIIISMLLEWPFFCVCALFFDWYILEFPRLCIMVIQRLPMIKLPKKILLQTNQSIPPYVVSCSTFFECENNYSLPCPNGKDKINRHWDLSPEHQWDHENERNESLICT